MRPRLPQPQHWGWAATKAEKDAYMSRSARAVLVSTLGLIAIAACSSSQSGQHAAVRPVQSSGSLTPSSEPSRLGPLKVVYHVKTVNADPPEQTMTLFSDGGSKFRMTWSPPGYEEWVVSDGIRAVESQDHGQLNYYTEEELTKRSLGPFLTAADLAKTCTAVSRLGSATILGRSADRYGCQDNNGEGLPTEITLDSKTGLLLRSTSDAATLTVTSIDLHPTIPAGSFDLSAFPSPAPTVPPCVRPHPGAQPVCHLPTPSP